MPRDLVPPDAERAAGVVIPLRSFAAGKGRLAAGLGAEQRTRFVRDMADRVADAAGAHTVVVVSSATEVVTWASERAFACIADPGTLDAAAHEGREWLRARGYERVLVAHGDLPLARTLEPVVADASPSLALIVPCHRHDGTPVLSLPADAPFRFAYGPGSFARHCEEARRVGLDVRVVHDPALAFDVDVPEDLTLLEPTYDSPARCP
jgi:2-phospho-L-lactate guanylyltransferase